MEDGLLSKLVVSAFISRLGRRSQSMEHLGPLSVDSSRSNRVGSTPQGSPRMVRSMSKGKINRRSVELDNDMIGRFL